MNLSVANRLFAGVNFAESPFQVAGFPYLLQLQSLQVLSGANFGQFVKTLALKVLGFSIKGTAASKEVKVLPDDAISSISVRCVNFSVVRRLFDCQLQGAFSIVSCKVAILKQFMCLSDPR